MNEWLLVTVCIAIILITLFTVRRFKQPILTYVRLVSSLLLLVLVWGFAEEAKLPLKVLMTVFALTSAAKAIKDYQKLYTSPDSDHKE
jgi:hypothetical protein